MKPASTFLNYFSRIYVVNLPHRTDRRIATEQELARLGPLPPQLEWYPALRATEALGFPSIGAYGCYQSHLGALRRAHADGLADVLILEDDIRILPVASEVWPAIEAALQDTPWDMLNLGFDEREFLDEKPTGPLAPVNRPLTLAHCYAVRGEILGRLIAFLELVASRQPGDPLGGPMHFDGALATFCAQNPEIRRLRATICLASQRSSRSDIAPPRWFDRNPITQPLISAIRSLKNRMTRD